MYCCAARLYPLSSQRGRLSTRVCQSPSASASFSYTEVERLYKLIVVLYDINESIHLFNCHNKHALSIHNLSSTELGAQYTNKTEINPKPEITPFFWRYGYVVQNNIFPYNI